MTGEDEKGRIAPVGKRSVAKVTLPAWRVDARDHKRNAAVLGDPAASMSLDGAFDVLPRVRSPRDEYVSRDAAARRCIRVGRDERRVDRRTSQCDPLPRYDQDALEFGPRVFRNRE